MESFSAFAEEAPGRLLRRFASPSRETRLPLSSKEKRSEADRKRKKKKKGLQKSDGGEVKERGHFLVFFFLLGQDEINFITRFEASNPSARTALPSLSLSLSYTHSIKVRKRNLGK
jgi:hypothetical protein